MEKVYEKPAMKKHHAIALTPKEAAKLFAVNPATVQGWIHDKLVPLVRGEGRMGREQLLDVRSLLALGIIAAARRGGVSMPVIQPICEFLRNITIEDLEESFALGKTILICAGEVVPARLVRPDENVLNDTGLALMLTAYDLQKQYSTLLRRFGY